MSDKLRIVETAEDLAHPVMYSPEAYISEEYARAERDKLWRKVWQMAGRLEDIPEVGNYLSYEILDDSVLIVRTAPDRIRAYHNVCPHRGRRLVDTPQGAKNARGTRNQFICGYHGWRFNLEGVNTHVPYKEDWQGALTDECAGLSQVNVDTWGGWVWINMDRDCESLRDFLEPAATMLDPFQLQNMRYRWRKWGYFDCNWKVALEAFNETYHVQTTHPEFMKFGEFRGWARAQGKHSNIGYDAPKGMDENQAAKLRVGKGDPRISTAEMQLYTWQKANTNTTQTLVDAALRLKDELPEGTPADQVLKHWLESARRDDEARMSARVEPPGRSSRTSRSGIPSTMPCATPRGPAATTPTSASSRPLFTSCSRRARNRRRSGNTARRPPKTGATCCPRISRTWLQCSKG